MELCAYAKLNLTLDVLGRREDGYHDLRMVMQSVDLCDRLTVLPAQAGEGRMSTTLNYLPSDGRNLAQQAARAFREQTGAELRVDIAIEKHIPVCAGMGGGSSDAAAVLLAMNELTEAGLSRRRLAEIGEAVGSDVPYCVLGGTMLAEGRGERLTPLPALPHCYMVVCKPAFSISTPQLFARVDAKKLTCRPDTGGLLDALDAGDLTEAARRLYNVFESVLEPRQYAEICEIKASLIDSGALGASMTGTGPAVFGLFDCEGAAHAACGRLRESWRDVFLCQSV